MKETKVRLLRCPRCGVLWVDTIGKTCPECGEEGRPQPKLADIKLKLKQKLEENGLNVQVTEGGLIVNGKMTIDIYREVDGVDIYFETDISQGYGILSEDESDKLINDAVNAIKTYLTISDKRKQKIIQLTGITPTIKGNKAIIEKENGTITVRFEEDSDKIKYIDASFYGNNEKLIKILETLKEIIEND